MTDSDLARGSLIAITGATGFLGSHIADLLVARGYRVRASIRPTSDLRWLRGQPIEAILTRLAPASAPAESAGGPIRDDAVAKQSDRTADDDLEQLLDGAAAVIHCAGAVRAPDAAGYRRINVETTRRLLATAARRTTCRVFVLISSLAAAGPAPLHRPRREEDPCRPVTEYGRSKLEAEGLLADPSLPFRTVALRPPALYGPRDRAFVPLFRLASGGWAFRLGRSLTGFSLVDGRDAATAAVALMEASVATGPYFVDDGRAYEWAEIAAALGEVFQRRLRTMTIPLTVLRLAARLMGARRAARAPLLHPDRLADLAAPGWVCSGEKLRRETGFQAERDLARGFTETLDFYKQYDWLG